MSTDVPDGHAFALCLTHDVDRPYKTYQAVTRAVGRREPRHLLDLPPGRNPHWRFDEITALEADLGVRSAFYFLHEQRLFDDRPPRAWLSPREWRRYAGRYDLSDPAIRRVIGDLEAGGWEVGLHGSYESYRDGDRLRAEKRRLDALLEGEAVGVRQHYLNVERPATWRRQAAAGLRYDASLGSSERFGFEHGHGVLRPFDDGFVVFPLTAMESALPDPGEAPDRARAACEALLREAAEHRAVATVLWHVARFSPRDFPGYRSLYAWLVRRALEMGAWVGPPAALYERMDHPGEATETSPARKAGDPPAGESR